MSSLIYIANLYLYVCLVFLYFSFYVCLSLCLSACLYIYISVYPLFSQSLFWIQHTIWDKIVFQIMYRLAPWKPRITTIMTLALSPVPWIYL